MFSLLLKDLISDFIFDVFSLLDIKKRNRRSHGKRKNGICKRNHITVLTLSELNKLLKFGRHDMLSRLSSLSFFSLRNSDEEANKFYDRKHDLYEAALLTRCMLFVPILILK